MKEIKCPYCGLYNNTISNNTLEIINDSDLFSIECNKCGKTFGVKLENGIYESQELPCRYGKPHSFIKIDSTHKQCEYCKQIINTSN